MTCPRTDCGDPSCDTCRPPREPCATCGALHADPEVSFCSLDCAVASSRVEPDISSAEPTSS